MASVSNRKSNLLNLFTKLQACEAEAIDAAKYTILGNVILVLDIDATKALWKEAKRVAACDEAKSFTPREIEQLLAQTAALTVWGTRTAAQNAAAAHTEFLRQIKTRLRQYVVPFVTPGLQIRNLPPGMQRFKVGSCEFSSDPKRIRAIFRQIGVTVDFRAKQRHAFPKGGHLKLPSKKTIAVVDVTTSSLSAPVQAQNDLQEAYGLIALLLDAVATDGPGGHYTRMPLLSWQIMPPLAPTCRFATEPADMPAQARTGTGFDQLWRDGYDIDLAAVEKRLHRIGFFDRERELFTSQFDMAGRIRTGLRWLTRALQAPEPEIQFLNFAIILEALFTAPSPDYKVSALIRDCVTKSSKWNDADDVRKLVGELYGKRSQIVHQGAIPRFMRELDVLHAIVVQCLGELLTARDHERTYVDMLARLGVNLEDYKQDVVAAAPAVAADPES